MGYPGYPRQQGPYPPQHDPFARQGSPALAIISAIVGLGVAGALTWQTLALLDLIGEFAGQMPGGWTTMIIGSFVVAFIALVGAVLVFARQIAGAYLLLAAGLLTAVTMLTAPLMAEDVSLTMIDITDPYTRYGGELYYRQLFGFDFDSSQVTLRFAALALSLILMIIAALPPSLNWMRRSRQDGYSAQQPGW
jgi:hypothetical protein